MKLRRSTREKKPPQHLQDFQLELDPTESLQTRAIRDELNQVGSLLESLTPEAGKQSASANKLQTPTFTPEEEKQSAASISKLQNENLKLELELTRAKIELARVKSAMAHESQSKMATPNAANVNTQNKGQCTTQRAPVPTLTALQSDTAVQEELKALEESLGDPILLGLSDELADPAQKLLEPNTTPRGKRPLLIPDFVSSLPVVLEEDRETVLGASGGTQIILKTSHEKKPLLNNITFPQWSAANFRIMHTLVKDGALPSMSDIMNYISYSTKVSELAKIYPLACVVQYDDLYRRMQFATGCKWGTESQFIYQQSLHKPETNQPGSTKQANRPPGRSTKTINPTMGKQVCYDFQRRQGCSYGTACKYDHVCIKPQCLGDHPQWKHTATHYPQA